MPDLMVHCGSRRVDRVEIDQSPTPSSTKTWTPVPHHRLLELVEQTIDGVGWRIESQAHALWGDGLRYFGLLEVQNGSAHEDYNLIVGLRNSHDRSFSASLAIGNCVLVCDNLSFGGEVTLARKHTRFIERDLPQVVSRAIGQLAEMRRTQDVRLEAYRNKRISNRDAHDLMVRSVDARILPVTKLLSVLAEWRKPSHAEFKDNGRSLWRLQNAFTESWKGSNLATLPRRSQSLHGLLDAACGLPG